MQIQKQCVMTVTSTPERKAPIRRRNRNAPKKPRPVKRRRGTKGGDAKRNPKKRLFKRRGIWVDRDEAYKPKGVHVTPRLLPRTPPHREFMLSRPVEFTEIMEDATDTPSNIFKSETRRRRPLRNWSAGDGKHDTPPGSPGNGVSQFSSPVQAGFSTPSPRRVSMTPKSARGRAFFSSFLQRLKCTTLRQVCRDLDITCSGRKSDLVSRIRRSVQ